MAALLAVAALLALPAGGAVANSVVLGPVDLVTGPTTNAIDCEQNPPSMICVWIGIYNVGLGGAGGGIAAPADGWLASWRVNGAISGDGAVRLHVVRPNPDGSYTGIASTPFANKFDGSTPNPGGVPMRAGDVLSITAANPNYLTTTGRAQVRGRATPGASFASLGIITPGQTALPPVLSTVNQVALYNATVELERPRPATMAPSAGPATGGSAVTIDGTHLAVATGVSFGGVPAQIVAADNETITVLAPPHRPGTVDVVVTTAGGSSFPIDATRFTYQPVDDGRKPEIKGLRVRPKRFGAANIGGPIVPLLRVGARVRYALTEDAKVSFAVQRAAPGRRVGRKCVQPKRSNRARPRCLRYRKVKGTFAHAGTAGANSFTFSGRVGAKALPPGIYRLQAIATDLFGNKSKKRHADFTIGR